MSAARPGGRSLAAAGVLLAALSSLAAAAADEPGRLVVLAPSAAEIAGELGLVGRIVGVCGQCDHPAELGRVADVGSYVTPSVEAVVALEPDLVLAVPSPGNRDAVRQLERLGIEVLVVRDRTIADLYDAVGRIARRCGVERRGRALADRIRGGLDDVRRTVAGRPRPSVLLVVGHRPLVVAGGGTLQDELIEVAGGRNLGRRLGESWPTLSLEALASEAPDVLIDAAMGSEAGLRAALPAGGVAAPRIVRVPIDQLVRAGPRVVEAARTLARELHPELGP